MKRKAEYAAVEEVSKKQATATSGLRDHFSEALFDPKTLQLYSAAYACSKPYKHAVVARLIDDALLRSVRREILDNISFTAKETDIYKIHQSGDLANLNGLDPAALEKLPSLLKLRDALYSHDFRQWISEVSGAGMLSGTKTDMAVNVYVPGCHLLCHDDVIGSRRVSYILYLTDPDNPWRSEWGGALRLYPTAEIRGGDGKMYKAPRPEWSKVIPPAWNQLSFFAVQPGESFHDVEEVYHRGAGVDEDDGGRVRMAISGWFHIPQEDEEGFKPGLEASLADKSSLQQLQGKAEQFDEPEMKWQEPVDVDSQLYPAPKDDNEELNEHDLDFLLQFMTPEYLTPDTVQELNELFSAESTLQLTDLFSPGFASLLRYQMENEDPALGQYETSTPPHKHRYQYMHSMGARPTSGVLADSPFESVLNVLLPSKAFRKWLAHVTGLTLKRCAILARRFRRGLDYQLAQSYEGEDPQLEFTLNVTPTTGWGAEEETEGQRQSGNAEEDNVGGYELYMAGDDEGEGEEEGSDDGVEAPMNVHSHTGAGDRRSAKQQRKADPAVYKAAADDDADDGILFSNPASWNTMSIVLRDKGTLRFVKYVSRAAKGDRLDFTGCYEVEDDDDDVDA